MKTMQVVFISLLLLTIYMMKAFSFLSTQKLGVNLRPRSLRTAFVRAPQRTRLCSSDRDTFYLTTPIYYVNGEPHLGHAYTSILTDIVARFQRSIGKKVYFLTGTDEHGQKVEQSANNSKKTPIAFADEVSAKFRELVRRTGCSNDDFIRTTEERHKAAVKHLWNTLLEKDQIYLGVYEGWYSIRDEAFYAESELVNGKAPTGAEVQWVREESYFFRLSQWGDKLLKFYEDNPDFISPRTRRNEVVSFVSQEEGLKDLSISRTTFTWGIPVPNNEKHVVYVWLDALTNYISALGYPQMDGKYAEFWPADLHVVGKDILRFHAVFWPAFLMAADLAPPKKVFAHGWWTKDGEKMSKSLGNVLNPFELIDQYGLDYFRYFLCTEIQFGNDGDFSHESFCTRINSELANDLGNLVQRAMVMINRNCDGVIPSPGPFTPEDEAIMSAAVKTRETVVEELDKLNLKTVAEAAIGLAKLGNRYIDAQAPWSLVKKGDVQRVQTVLYVLVEVLRVTAIYLEPVIPSSCAQLFDQMGVPPEYRTFASISTPVPSGLKIMSPQPLFPRIEPPASAESAAEEPKKEISKASRGSGKEPKPEDLARIEEKYGRIACSKQLDKLVKEVGDSIRSLKAEKAEKSVLAPLVAELTYLKNRLEAVQG